MHDARDLEGSGFVGVDCATDYDDAKMQAYIRHYVKEHLRSSELHPMVGCRWWFGRSMLLKQNSPRPQATSTRTASLTTSPS